MPYYLSTGDLQMRVNSINQYYNYTSIPKSNPAMGWAKPVMVQPVTPIPKGNLLDAIKYHFATYGRRINYTWQHKKAFLQVEKELTGKNSWKGYCHDLDKLIMYILGFPKQTAHNIHVATSPHHIRNGKVKDPIMTVIDWECCRYTKPDKFRTAREYYEEFCPQIPEIDEAFKKLGL